MAVRGLFKCKGWVGQLRGGVRMGQTSDGKAGCEEREKNVKEGKRENFYVIFEGPGVK